MKKFKATFFGIPTLEEIEIIRETDKCVFLKGGYRERRENKSSNYHEYFETRGEAKNFIITKAREKVENAQSRLDYATELLAEMEAL